MQPSRGTNHLDPKQQFSQQQAFQRALAFLKNGDAELAEEMCNNALELYPEDANFMCLSGRALIMLGRFGEAEERLNTAITLAPEFSRPYVVRGEMRLMQGQFENAVQNFRRAVELGDKDPNTQLKLGRALLMQGDRETAKIAVDESLRLDPSREQLARAFELEKTGKPAEAERIYRDILKRDPGNVDALRLLAQAASSQKQHKDAEVLLKRALELAPDFGRAMADLVGNQLELEKTKEALEYAQRLVKIGSDNPDTFVLLGSAFSASGHYDDAIVAYRQALKKSPEHPGALSGLGHNLKTIGRQDEAIAIYRQCIRSNPFFAEIYWSLANLKTFRFTDDELQAMEELLQHPNIPEVAQVQLCNALGLENEGRKHYDKAFEYFQKCNAIKRGEEYYDSVATEDLHDRIIGHFTEEFFSQPVAKADKGVTPIFIVGLPRSGSTLLEQILASHSLVEGTHELSDLPRVINNIPQVFNVRGRYPENLKDFDSGAFQRLGNLYLERVSKFLSGSPCFTDKNPNNFAHVGLVHLALPHAIFINARRHPLDSCLGTYKQLFAKGQPFSYDLTDIAEFYVEYLRMMDHWHEVLPGKVLDVHYEDVVADVDGQVRRILEHCGLPFEAQCLRFHETDRAVKTASSEQVRRPIYGSSVNLWRNYEPHLAPLIDILEPVLRKLPKKDRPGQL